MGIVMEAWLLTRVICGRFRLMTYIDFIWLILEGLATSRDSVKDISSIIYLQLCHLRNHSLMMNLLNWALLLLIVIYDGLTNRRTNNIWYFHTEKNTDDKLLIFPGNIYNKVVGEALGVFLEHWEFRFGVPGMFHI